MVLMCLSLLLVGLAKNPDFITWRGPVLDLSSRRAPIRFTLHSDEDVTCIPIVAYLRSSCKSLN